MNKIYAHILLTIAITVSTTCAEREPKPLNIQSSSPIVLPANSKVYSLETLNNLLQSQSYSAKATKDRSSNTTRTIQKKYTDLDFVPVYVSTNAEEIELTPVYRPIDGSSTEYWNCITKTKKTVPQEKQKPHDTYLINRLYNSARDFIDFRTSQHNNMTDHDFIFTQNKKYITLIELMIAAKKKGVTEDFMGNFSYEKRNDPTASVVFACLKKYILTICDSGEKLPFNSDDFYTNNDLIQTLKTTCKKSITAEQIKTTAPNYPAYDALFKATRKTIQYKSSTLMPYLYASTNILPKKYPQYSHITNLDECYDILVKNLCADTSDYEDIYNSLALIEQIKKITKITQEKKLGYNFLILEKQQTIKEKILRYPETTYFRPNQNGTALFCILVEKYNKDRGNKVTPNPIQLSIYTHLKWITLPDSFNTDLLDKNYYALKELYELVLNAKKLKNLTASDLQDLVDQHYTFNEKEQS
jgi:hypothetical protein